MSRTEFIPRPGYEAVAAYRADRPAVEIDLGDSTNQWGVPPSALAALADWGPRDVSEYPPVDSPRLTAAAASYFGVPAENLISGGGSDSLIDAAFRALAAPGDRVAHPSPTFAMVPVSARANGLVPVGVPVRPNGDIDADAILATGARIIYLCTPNNPTGIPHSRKAIEQIIDGAPGVVILDEAYAEYAEECYTPMAAQYPHLLVTRTLSKAFGLAGLRVGFGVGAPALINEVLKARGPYKVNAFAERAATAALTNDRAWIADIVAKTRVVRAQFSEALHSIGLNPLPSNANFVCVPVRDSRATVQQLYAHSIAVRGFAGLPVTGDVLRIGLAPWPVLERVCAALHEIGSG